ncbi:MAG TPA: hypothetical protein VG733_19925 [Chthoniobacteraceae bacterium]|nr:hypothetical protein [Chthoniobacteraceae bacterium]
MNPAPAEPPHRLKFHWPQRPQVSLALIGFIFLSVLAHGLAFYILQVVDPPAFRVPPPPVQVNLLTASTPENQAVLQWVDLNDPSIFAQTHEIVPGGIYELTYERSPAYITAAPKTPLEEQPAVQFPPAEDTMAVIGSTEEAPPTRPAQLLSLPTDLTFSAELAGRKIVKRPPMQFSTAVEGREPASFMVGVGPEGKVLYTFFLGIETDEQAKAIDRQAAGYLESIEFAKAPGNNIAWGIATYYWGDDSNPAGSTHP